MKRDFQAGLFGQVCALKGLPVPEAEYRFAPPRKWRADFAWVAAKLLLEVDGGVFGKGKRCLVCHQSSAGRHTRGAGWLKDAEKLNEAAARGWRVLRVTPGQLGTTATFTLIRRCLPDSVVWAVDASTGCVVPGTLRIKQGKP